MIGLARGSLGAAGRAILRFRGTGGVEAGDETQTDGKQTSAHESFPPRIGLSKKTAGKPAGRGGNQDNTEEGCSRLDPIGILPAEPQERL